MVFLSAGVPDILGDSKYVDTANLAAIRDAVRAVAKVVIPSTQLVWGGHPAITPLINYSLLRINGFRKNAILYQSAYFNNQFPAESNLFDNRKIIKSEKSREASLIAMREKMIGENSYKAGIFIGGMKGVEDEYRIFKKEHPAALVIAIASSGSAAKVIFESIQSHRDFRLTNDYVYVPLIKSLLENI